MNIRTSKDTKLAARQALSNTWGNSALVAFICIFLTGSMCAGYYFLNIVTRTLTTVGSIITLDFFKDTIYHNADFVDAFTTVPNLENLLSGIGVVTAIVLLVIGSLISIFLFLVFFALSANLFVGVSRYYLNLVSSNNAKISDLFFSFKKCPLKSLWVSLIILLKVVLWGLVGLIPAIICRIIYMEVLYTSQPAYIKVLLMFGVIEFFVISLILMIYAIYKYSLSFFILAKDPSLKVRQVVRLAKETANGHKRENFLLDLSFIGWFLLLPLTYLTLLGIGGIVASIFLAPYICASQAVRFCDITGIPTVRHDLENPYETYQPYQGFQNSTYNNQAQSTDNTQNSQQSEYPAQANGDIKEDSGENKSEE